MRLLDRYLILEQLKILMLALFTLSAVMALEKATFLSNLLLTKGASFSDVGGSMLYLLPAFFTMAAPLAILLSSLMVFSRMSADNEITAMRSGGVSLYRLVMPVMMIAGFAMAVTLYLSLYVVHDSNTAFQLSAFKIMRHNLNLQIKERLFYTRFRDVVIHVNHKQGDTMLGVFIADRRNPDREKIIEASRGRINDDAGEGGVRFDLEEGAIHTVGEEGAYQTIAFDAYAFRVNLEEEMGGEFEKEIPHLSPGELLDRIETAESRRIAGDESIKAPNQERVALYQKFAAPIACLALGLLGAPLGIMAHRRGSSGGIGLGVVMLMVNYLLWTVGGNLGEEGKIPPMLAVWSSNLIMGGAGVYLLVRASKDAMPSRLAIWFAETTRLGRHGRAIGERRKQARD